jgi:hypothetical protein
MRIFGGRRNPSRRQRWREAARGRSAAEGREEPNPFDGLVDKRTVVPTGESRKKKGKGLLARVTMGHVVFLLAGVVLGVGALLLVPAISARVNAPPAEEPPPEAAPARPPGQIPQATTPVEAVRLMFQAAVNGDRETAYAQWENGPDEAATVRAGQPLTLAELTTATASVGKRIRLADYSYTVKSQSGDEAEVVQKRGQVVLQIFSLHRRGAYWKIRYASSP